MIFDLDGTLYRSPEYVEAFYDSLLELMGEKLGIDKERAFKVFADIRRKDISTASAAERLGEDRSALYRELAQRLHPEKYIARDPALNDTLSTLRSRGLKLAVLTMIDRSTPWPGLPGNYRRSCRKAWIRSWPDRASAKSIGRLIDPTPALASRRRSRDGHPSTWVSQPGKHTQPIASG